MKLDRIREAQVVRIPFVRKMSFKAMGIPVRISISPPAIRLSASSAFFSASSGVMVMKDFTFSSTAPIRARKDFVASTDDTSRAFSFSCNSWMVSSYISMYKISRKRFRGNGSWVIMEPEQSRRALPITPYQ